MKSKANNVYVNVRNNWVIFMLMPVDGSRIIIDLKIF